MKNSPTVSILLELQVFVFSLEIQVLIESSNIMFNTILLSNYSQQTIYGIDPKIEMGTILQQNM